MWPRAAFEEYRFWKSRSATCGASNRFRLRASTSEKSQGAARWKILKLQFEEGRFGGRLNACGGRSRSIQRLNQVDKTLRHLFGSILIVGWPSNRSNWDPSRGGCPTPLQPFRSRGRIANGHDDAVCACYGVRVAAHVPIGPPSNIVFMSVRACLTGPLLYDDLESTTHAV